MKYLNRDSFQVGGYSRAYADNWQAIFGAAKAKLDAEKSEQDANVEKTTFSQESESDETLP